MFFTYLHLAPDPIQTKGLFDSGYVAIAYKTVTDKVGGLPLLAPMSEVAGRMAIQAGAHALELTKGGRGMLLGGVSGVPAARVVVIGGGVVGTNAARVAMGVEAHVTVLINPFTGYSNWIFSTDQELTPYFRRWMPWKSTWQQQI